MPIIFMRKIKLYLTVAALLLITAVVFAGKSRFTGGTATNLYFYDALRGTYSLITASSGVTELEYSTTLVPNQMTVNPNATGFASSDGLYYYCNGFYYPVYFQ